MIKTCFGKIILPAALCLVIAAPALAQRPPPGEEGRRHKKGGVVKKVLRQLDLTEEQKTQVRAIGEKFRKNMKPQRDAIRAAQDKVHQALLAEPFSESKARSAFRQASLLREDQFIARAKMMEEINKLLTPEQREKFKKIKAEAREKHRERRGPPPDESNPRPR